MRLPQQLSVFVLSAFEVLALALATVGLYGVVSYDVAQRRARSVSGQDSASTQAGTRPETRLLPRAAMDRSGVTVATAIRKQRPKLPLMGVSGCLDELAKSEREVFTEWLPKATSQVEKLEAKLEHWRKSAILYRHDRAVAAKRELDLMRRSGALPAPQVETMRGFLPGTHRLRPDDEYVTPDEMLRNEGWRLHLVEAGFSWSDEAGGGSTDVRTASVVPFWIRQEGPTTIALLHGHPCIYNDATTLEDVVVEGALSLMYGYHRRFSDSPEKPLSPEMTALRDYLRSIFAEGS